MLRTIQTNTDSSFPLSLTGLLLGFFLWIFLYFVMPRPIRSYVLAHELTHALWGWLMGARIRKLRISDKGGSVSLSQSNFLIELAPYFFPFYTVLVILLYGAVNLFWDQRTYEPLWLGFVGLTWGFHLTFTISALAEHQPDIQQNGRLFSYAVIYTMNILGICFWIVAVAQPTLGDFFTRLFAESLAIYMAVAQRVARILWTVGEWLSGPISRIMSSP